MVFRQAPTASRTTGSCGGHRPTPGVARAQLAVGIAGPLIAILLLPAPAAVLAQLGETGPSAILGAATLGCATVASWALAAWALVVIAAGFATRLPGRTGRAAQDLLHRLAPAVVRRLIATAAGVTLSIGITAPLAAAATPAAPAAITISDFGPPGSAAEPTLPFGLDWLAGAVDAEPLNAPTESGSAAAGGQGSGGAIAGGQGSDSATGGGRGNGAADRESVAADAPPTPTAEAAGIVTVQPGDCLWSIAASRLPLGASAAQIDSAWREWYATNRSVIGPDPNLVIPGQQLRAPQQTPPDHPGGAR